MIIPKNRDMNRSRDVAGPKLKRSYEQEIPMEKKMDLYHDDAPTGTIEKTPLQDLHFGEHEAPLSATGMQDVVVPMPMGQDHMENHPSISKGATIDEQHHGKKEHGYSKVFKSIGSKKD